ncbi:DNA-directed RNA polymerase subunit H [archaeon]|nr:DNA-directed RNA polymerase subunit H [archaeon]
MGGKTKEVDIIKHELVPKHIILNENEKNELLKKYGITLRQLPRISATDPVIKVLNGKIGDVVKITRKSAVAGETPYYRVVIKG